MKDTLLYFCLMMAFCLSSFGISCDKRIPNEERATNEILMMHHAQKEYHFQKKAHEFASQLAEEFISVNRGEISRMTYEEHARRYENYFSSVDFKSWDDAVPPIIRFSDDYSMAYTIVQKDVVLQYENEEGKEVEDSTRFAWTAIYTKSNGEWKIESVASTNSKPVIKSGQ